MSTESHLLTWDAEITENHQAHSLTWDAVITEPRSAQLTWDVIVREPHQADLTWDAQIKLQTQLTWDTVIYEPGGQYRGDMTMAERDALERVDRGDHIIALDAGQTPRAQLWDGSKWIEGMTLGGMESGQERTHKFPTPTTAQYVEAGNEDEPLRLTDGMDSSFAVDKWGGTGTSTITVNEWIKMREIYRPARVYQSASYPLAQLKKKPNGRYLTTWPLEPQGYHRLFAAISSNLMPIVNRAGWSLVSSSSANGLWTRLYSLDTSYDLDSLDLDLSFDTGVPDAVVTVFEMDRSTTFGSGSTATGTGTSAATPALVSDKDSAFVAVFGSLTGTAPTITDLRLRDEYGTWSDGWEPVSAAASSSVGQAVAIQRELSPAPSGGISWDGTADVASGPWSGHIYKLTKNIYPITYPLLAQEGALFIDLVAGNTSLFFADDGNPTPVVTDLVHDVPAHTHDGSAESGGTNLTGPYFTTFYDLVQQASAPTAPAGSTVHRHWTHDTLGLLKKDSTGAIQQAIPAADVREQVQTVANTTTETTLLEVSLDQAIAQVGTMWEFCMYGEIDNIATSGTFTFRIRADVGASTNNITANLVVPTQGSLQTDKVYFVRGMVSINTIGSSAKMIGSMDARYQTSSAHILDAGTEQSGNATANPFAWRITVQMQTANAGNIVRVHHGYARLVGLTTDG